MISSHRESKVIKYFQKPLFYKVLTARASWPESISESLRRAHPLWSGTIFDLLVEFVLTLLFFFLFSKSRFVWMFSGYLSMLYLSCASDLHRIQLVRVSSWAFWLSFEAAPHKTILADLLARLPHRAQIGLHSLGKGLKDWKARGQDSDQY